MTPDSALDRLLAFSQAATGSLPSSASVTSVGIGWATVDLERAAGELAADLGIPAARFVPGAGSEVLGARCLVVEAGLAAAIALVVLEPATEGRLAATLARVGEGPAAIWLATASDNARDRNAASGGGLATTPPRIGPFGVEALILAGPIHGPHLLLVSPPGTIHT